MKKLIRVGTAGSLNEDVHVRELVLRKQLQLTQTSSVWPWPRVRFSLISFDLLDKAYHIVKELGMTTHVGESFCHPDVFYSNYI